MTLDLPKTSMAYPKTFISIVAPLSGLAVFLILASSFLASQPLGSAVRGYFYGVGQSEKIEYASDINKAVRESSNDSNVIKHASASASFVSKNNDTMGHSSTSEHITSKSGENEGNVTSSLQPSKTEPYPSTTTDSFTNQTELDDKNPAASSAANLGDLSLASPILSNASQAVAVDPGCDLYNGSWVKDSAGPLYRNDSCPVLTQMQNCQGNGRPDKEYENWRWKPAQCDLPRFDAKRFLQLMRGKTLAYIGDSVARNQMESLLCILWQVEEPKNRGNKRMQRYYFKSTNTMIVRIWSSWLVHQTSEPFDFAPQGVAKLHLDSPDEHFMEFILSFDVIVLSSGHWFAKQSVYILNNEIVGGQLWWPNNSRPKKINNVEAFRISVETILSAIATHASYSGLAILRTYSPDHYEGGAWNTGGSCTGQVRPALDGELVENGFTNVMHEKQVDGFHRAIKKQTNKSKLRLMDITNPFSYRHDGHPGPYRNPDPNKITKRGPDGKPPPQDCLHWCMPGPVDTWNEMMLEIIAREFSSSPNYLS